MTTVERSHIAIVAPCHIPPSQAWIHALSSEANANDATVVIVDDSNGHLGPLPEEWIILNYVAQMELLGDLYGTFANLFHKSSACRVVGHLWAYVNKYDIIIGLDSDCIVKRNFVRDHKQFMNAEYGCGWFNPIGYPHYSRGFPYSARKWPIKANMGLWENVLDINGKDRLPNEPKEIKVAGSTVPTAPFPFSGMNFALTRDSIFGFLFLPNFDWENKDKTVEKFRRVDDIWGGYIFQKLLHKLHWSSMLGYPFVFHDTVVIPEEDAADEEAMYKYEDRFLSLVDEACNIMARPNVGKTTMAEAMLSFLDAVQHSYNMQAPFEPLREAFEWWADVIKRYAK